MRAINRRLQKLEKVFAPAIESETVWGNMAGLRDELLRGAEERGRPVVAQLTQELDALGPIGLWRETARSYLSDHGFVQAQSESFAETMSRALGIGCLELRVCMAEGRLGTALLDRFGQPGIATDNT